MAEETFYKDHWVEIEAERLDRYEEMFRWGPALEPLLAPPRLRPGSFGSETSVYRTPDAWQQCTHHVSAFFSGPRGVTIAVLRWLKITAVQFCIPGGHWVDVHTCFSVNVSMIGGPGFLERTSKLVSSATDGSRQPKRPRPPASRAPAPDTPCAGGRDPGP